MTSGTDWIDQAQRLVEAVRGSLAAATSAAATSAATASSTADASSADASGTDPAGHSADCRWCPVCQVAAVVRGERPEVTAALADVLTTAATALRTVAAGGPPAGPPAPAASPEPESEPTAPVQHIEIA